MRGLGGMLLSAWAKPMACLLGLLPCAFLVHGALLEQLGPNPAETLIRSTGEWTLRFLCLALAVTPLRVMAGVPAFARFRRILGLLVYFYAALHLLSYCLFDMGLEWMEIARDIWKRPFILVGFLAFVLLTPLALTSFDRAIRALGARRWQALHRAVYAVAALGVLHFFWMRSGKNDFLEVLVYAAILGGLLTWRVQRRLRSAIRPVRAG
jgi:sulfoxide reductase heme-binding subunit YedZ